MAAADIVAELESLGSEAIRKVFLAHGAREPVLGVKIEDLKKIQKRIGTDHALALELYATGIHDAMYLAGLIADDLRMSRKDLRLWARQAISPALSEYTVPWVASGSPHGPALAREWIESGQEHLAAAGWSTFGAVVAVRDDSELDLEELAGLLRRVGDSIHDQPNRVRYVMNGFLIAVGSYVLPLTQLAVQVGEKVGRVKVDMGKTACKVPYAPEYIQKVQQRGALGKKRKSVKC